MTDCCKSGGEGPASDRAEFWRSLWDAQETPWDLEGPHPEIAARSDLLAGRGRVLVPGAGRGSDALALAALGHRVVAVDFAVPEHRVLADLDRAGVEFRARDAFAGDPEDEGAFDLVFEHTFLCALPPARRADWGRLIHRSLKSGGALAAIVFPIGKPLADGGPPFGLEVADVQAALGPELVLEIDEPVHRPAPGRRYAERFVLFRRV